MRARALTFSFLTSLSVLRQEHRFPNTLFLCSRTFSFALGPPRPPTLLFLFLSLSSPSQNLTLFLYVSCSGNGGWFNLYFEPGSPPRIGFARFALMFRQNELYKRKHTSVLHLMLRIESDERSSCAYVSDKPLRR